MGAVQGFAQPTSVHRLQQVVNCIELKSAYGIFVIGRHKSDQQHRIERYTNGVA